MNKQKDASENAKNKPSLHTGHRERVREKFTNALEMNAGLGQFSSHEILEMLLFFAISRGDTNETAHKLIDEFGSLTSVFDADIRSLQEVEGIGKNSATLIKFVSSVIKAYMDESESMDINIIKSTDDLLKYMKHKFISEQNECFYLLCMGNNGKILLNRRVADGTPESLSIAPKELTKIAIRTNSAKVAVAHNHPHGLCIPSTQDIRATSILYDEFRRFDIDLIDHIIVAPDGVYSMKKNGMFPQSKTPIF